MLCWATSPAHSGSPPRRAAAYPGFSLAALLQCNAEGVDALPVLTSSRVGDRLPVDEIDAVMSASVAALRELEQLGPQLAVPLLEFGLSGERAGGGAWEREGLLLLLLCMGFHFVSCATQRAFLCNPREALLHCMGYIS